MTAFWTRASLALAIAVGAGLAAQAQQPSALRALADCRKIAEDAARLACFDTAAAALDQAETKGDIVVVDREQAGKMRRQAFGFALPSLNFFDRGDKPAALDRVTGVAARAYRQGSRWVIELEDGGGTWLQTDDEPQPRGARKGSRIEIRKAAMGSFFINVDGQRAMRARRVE
jgi:hypothetical protein